MNSFGVEEEFCSRCTRWVDAEDYDYDERWCKRCVAQVRYGDDVRKCEHCGRWFGVKDRNIARCSSCRARSIRTRKRADHIKTKFCVRCRTPFRNNRGIFCGGCRKFSLLYTDLRKRRGYSDKDALALVLRASSTSDPLTCAYCGQGMKRGLFCAECYGPQNSYHRYVRRGMKPDVAMEHMLHTYRGKRWKEIARRAKLQSRT